MNSSVDLELIIGTVMIESGTHRHDTPLKLVQYRLNSE